MKASPLPPYAVRTVTMLEEDKPPDEQDPHRSMDNLTSHHIQQSEDTQSSNSSSSRDSPLSPHQHLSETSSDTQPQDQSEASPDHTSAQSDTPLTDAKDDAPSVSDSADQPVSKSDPPPPVVGVPRDSLEALDILGVDVTRMLQRVAASGAPVKSQQRGDPDLSAEDKVTLLRELWAEQPARFLERYHEALSVRDLGCFEHVTEEDAYLVNFYLEAVRKRTEQRAGTAIRNKRFAALRELVNAGEYFSEECMRARDPLLYEQCIGRFLSEEEVLARRSIATGTPESLADVLIDVHQEVELRRRLQQQQDAEDDMEEEEEDSDDENDMDQREARPNQGLPHWGSCGRSPSREEGAVSLEERALLKEEFVSRMYRRFLDGHDQDFDYSSVDDNADYDNLDIVEQDEEDRYFDED
ncbi:coiled-coil domain-containing protein 97 isoform X2 [Petromyzon marinus]|uniref:Coiled-coil domain-containing protein 97 isoform X1 n=2 Tax=Petromyzon marinus TaxID=7757 RepID=A0AAJ7TQE6_PETMA|nr:coiled-coil domain-containing protein 97 isoform X1 [Petromyzon marinus]